MPVPPETDSFRRASEALTRVARGDAQVAALVVGEVLLAQAEQRSAAVSHALIDTRMGSHGASEETCTVNEIAPIGVLRHGPRNDDERALVSVLMARHLGTLLDGSGGSNTVRALLSGLDWLEFTGPYAPYTAARVALSGDTLSRLEKLLQDAPVEAPSAGAAAAVRALRGVAKAPSENLATVREEFPAGLRAPENISVAGEVEGMHRGWLARTLGIVTGWSRVRGVFVTLGRVAFSFRRPMTVAIDGDVLRVVGHTEILGRTLRTFDERYPLDQLVEIRREVRFPGLPVAVALVGLAAGALFGARAVVEGAGVAYFPLIGLGIGLILGGLIFDLLVRALFPGLRGQGRIVVRAREARAVVLSRLAIEEADKLLDALDRRFGATPAVRAKAEPKTAPKAARKEANAPSAPARPVRRREGSS